MKRKVIPLVLLILLVGGCRAVTINRADLAREIDAINENTMHRGVFYVGSDNMFHYMAVVWEMKRDKLYAVSVHEVAITNQSVLTKDKRKWRRLISGVSSSPPDGYEVLFNHGNKYFYLATATNKAL